MVHVALSLFLSCCRSVSLIDSACRQANEKLHRLAAVLPDAASLPPLEYDTSRRADPEVLQRLVAQAKTLRVREDGVARDTQCFIPFPACLPHLATGHKTTHHGERKSDLYVVNVQLGGGR